MATDHLFALGANTPGWLSNLCIENATTTNADDSIQISGHDSTALSATNPGYVTLPGAAGTLVTFQVTADVTINLTGAHWGHGARGDLTDAILRVLAINDNGTLRWGVALLGGRTTLLTTDTNATSTNINLPEEVLCTAAVASATNFCREVGWFRATFDDTAGAAEDLWAVQSGVGDLNTGESADGFYQPFVLIEGSAGWDGGGTSFTTCRMTQVGRIITIAVKAITGTSDSTGTDVVLPTKALNDGTFACGKAIDNGVTAATTLRCDTNADSVTLSLFPSLAGGSWTASGTKAADINFSYEVGPAASFIS